MVVVYGNTDDGKYEFVSLSADTLNGALEVMRKSFFLDENLAKAVELYKYPEAMDELAELSARAADDGCSIVALEKKSGTVVAVVFNKLQYPVTTDEPTFYGNFVPNSKEPAAKTLMQFMNDANIKADLFNLGNVDCVLEVMFASTLREYRGQGLATTLCRHTVDLARKLLAGENVKVGIKRAKLSLKPIPKMVSMVATTFITQRVGETVGFKKACVYGFDDWSFNGKRFSDMIGCETLHARVEYFKL